MGTGEDRWAVRWRIKGVLDVTVSRGEWLRKCPHPVRLGFRAVTSRDTHTVWFLDPQIRWTKSALAAGGQEAGGRGGPAPGAEVSSFFSKQWPGPRLSPTTRSTQAASTTSGALGPSELDAREPGGVRRAANTRARMACRPWAVGKRPSLPAKAPGLAEPRPLKGLAFPRGMEGER